MRPTSCSDGSGRGTCCRALRGAELGAELGAARCCWVLSWALSSVEAALAAPRAPGVAGSGAETWNNGHRGHREQMEPLRTSGWEPQGRLEPFYFRAPGNKLLTFDLLLRKTELQPAPPAPPGSELPAPSAESHNKVEVSQAAHLSFLTK